MGAVCAAWCRGAARALSALRRTSCTIGPGTPGTVRTEYTRRTRMAMQTIEELFEHELKDIYSAENALLDALEQMAAESSDREIKKGYTQHRKETQGQIKRLDKIFRTLGQKPQAATCPGIEGLIKEKKVFMRE